MKSTKNDNGENEKGKPSGRMGRKAMGPRAGSPAAETHRIGSGFFPVFMTLAIGLAFGNASSALAATARAQHSLTVVIAPPELSIAEEQEGETSQERDPIQKSHYFIENNCFSPSPVEGVLAARVEEVPSGLSVAADVGDFTSTIDGQPLTFQERVADFQIVGTSPTPLADAAGSGDGRTRILSGTVPIVWKATPPSGSHAATGQVLISLTLKDS